MNTSREIPITCHKVSSVFTIAPIRWITDKYPVQCSYCGSLHFYEVRRFIDEGGKLGGSDWKYGYPHKFYVYPKFDQIYQYKFYTDHLIDLLEEEFTPFAALLKEHTGIEFSRDGDGNLMYKAPFRGYQR